MQLGFFLQTLIQMQKTMLIDFIIMLQNSSVINILVIMSSQCHTNNTEYLLNYLFELNKTLSVFELDTL